MLWLKKQQTWIICNISIFYTFCFVSYLLSFYWIVKYLASDICKPCLGSSPDRTAAHCLCPVCVCSDTLMLLLKICRLLTMFVSSVERRWSLEPRNYLVITFSTPGKSLVKRWDSTGKIHGCKHKTAWMSEVVSLSLLKLLYLKETESVVGIKQEFKWQPFSFVLDCNLFLYSFFNNVVFWPPHLSTAACAPGSSASRPVPPVEWTSSELPITIRLLPQPRPRPPPLQPLPTRPQPRLLMVRVKTSTHEHNPHVPTAGCDGNLSPND